MFLFTGTRRSKSSDRRRRSSRDRERDSERRRRRVSREKIGTTRSHRSSRGSSSRDGQEADDAEQYVEKPYERMNDLPTRPGRKVSRLVPEMERRRRSAHSSNDSRSSLPYPSFSKAHSREAVNSNEDFSKPRKPSLYTPDTTDFGTSRSKSPLSRKVQGVAPPSPPLTANESHLRKATSGSSIRHNKDGRAEKDRTSPQKFRETSPQKQPRFSASRSSLRDAEEGRSVLKTAARKTPESSPERLQASAAVHHKRSLSLLDQVRTSSRSSPTRAGRSQTGFDDKALGAQKITNPKLDVLRNGSSAAIPIIYSKPYESASSQTSRAVPASHQAPSRASDGGPNVEDEEASNVDTIQVPPAPPPPPDLASTTTHKVDYLLQNGGLSKPVSRYFLSALRLLGHTSHMPYTSLQSMPGQITPLRSPGLEVSQVFQPLNNLLDDYSAVLNRRGSIAVATGYRSVARRLLDRLEAVFARNISSESCACVMCCSGDAVEADNQLDTGLSWGEILEFASGRRDLPPWPPFSLPAAGAGLGIFDGTQEAPMQKLDIDVPEEFRDHYIKQSKKTKVAVQNWLASQPEAHVSPPEKVDNEMLAFTILTYLEPEQRRTFTALMKGLKTLPDSRAPTPLQTDQKTDFLATIGLSLQRLYGLSTPPREPESALFLLRNPDLHNVLATLTAINGQEWEILISGRFNGFLWSGAEEQGSILPPRNSQISSNIDNRSGPFSRTATPLNGLPTRTAPGVASHTASPFANSTSNPAKALPITPKTPKTPMASNVANAPGPVAIDEETEMAVLAEVEREIFAGMEALEDAFEALHTKAEIVRTALRERSAGLSISAQSLQGAAGVEVRTDTPFSASGWPGLSATPSGVKGWNGSLVNGVGNVDGDEGWVNDNASELAPDDSASNIGFRQKTRRKRRVRRETRTPALVEEE